MVGQHRMTAQAETAFRSAEVVAEGVSFESYLRFFGEIHAEWVANTVIELESKTIPHQRTLMFSMTCLALYMDFKRLGIVLPMGVPMFVGYDLPAREPDLMVIFDQDKVKENYIDGPADVVVEIVSVESSRRDRGDKFVEYEIAGVNEYWLFDPLRYTADVYELGTDQRYHRRALDAQGQITSEVLPGFALDPALLWDDDRPGGAELVALVQQMVGE